MMKLLSHLRAVAHVARYGADAGIKFVADLERVAVEAEAFGISPLKAVEALREGTRSARLLVLRVISDAMLGGEDVVEAARGIASMTTSSVTRANVMAETLAQFNNHDLSRDQAMYVLGELGLGSADIDRLLHASECVVVWFGEGGHYSHMEVPEGIEMSVIRTALAEASSQGRN